MRLLDSKQSDFIFKMEIAHSAELGLGLKFIGYEKDGKFYTIETLFNNL